jgi:putative DNA primase/helicase
MGPHEAATAGGPPPELDEGWDAASNVVPFPAPEDAATHDHTDLRNAERLIEEHGDDLRYIITWKRWAVWRGSRWTVEADDGEATCRGKDVVRRMLAAARQRVEVATREALVTAEKHGAGSPQAQRAEAALAAAKGAHSWAVRSQSSKALSAMVGLAKSDPAIRITHDALDRDSMLLNCPNGTVDLATGALRPHNRADLVTKVTGAPYDAAARSELWDRVLLESMAGDAELVAYFQRAAGYSCTGRTDEEKLFAVIGPTRGGKSTIVQAMISALGDYARTADFEAFLAQKNPGGPKNEIARLAGARLVASIEVDKGRKLAQGLVKTLTGGDVVTARFLYSEAFEFRPTFKLWLVANDAPDISDDDAAMWARIHRVPFPCTVPEEKRDPRVKAALVDVERSGGAVLAWMISGCVQWQDKGLGSASAVRAATDAYRADADPLRDFLSETCRLGAGLRISRKALREAYESWAHEAGGRSMLTAKDFADRLRRVAGVADDKTHGTRVWTGIDLAGLFGAPESSQKAAGAPES